MNYTNSDLNEKLLDNSSEKDEENISIEDINNNIQIKNWNSDIENLLKCWGEKCGGLSIMHSNDRKYWREKSNKISIISIILTTFSSSLSLSSTSSSYYEYIMYIVGFIGLGSTLLQSLKQFYNADEKASEHKVISRQYSNYYRSIKLQLALKSKDRVPINEFVGWATKEYEKMLQDAPIINTTTIEEFKEKFKSYKCYKPDVCETDITIEINKNI
jgi:hypothetical protein